MNTLLYLLGIHFALHAIDEHKALHTGAYSQLKVCFDHKNDSKYLLYKEYSAKNNQGGLRLLNKKPKEMQHMKTKLTLSTALYVCMRNILQNDPAMT